MAQELSDWKACMRQKRIGGSNPPHSANNRQPHKVLGEIEKGRKRWKNASVSGILTAKEPHENKMRKVTVNLYYRGNLDKNGTAPLLLGINHASSTCYIPLVGVRLKPNQWDAKNKKVIRHPQADTINSVAVTNLGKATEAIMKLGSVRGLSTAQVRDMIAEYIYPSDDVDCGVVAVMQNYMNACVKPNTKDKFKQTLTHIKRWLGAKGARALQFGDIDVEWLQSFDRYLVTYCPSVNSRSIHLRNIRTVFNHALNKQLTTAAYPFRRYKIKSQPANPTPLTLEQVKVLWQHHPRNPAQAYALDVWRMVFALIGINLTDLGKLRSISQGRINYKREKTGRLYSIKVEDAAKRLIQAHRGKIYLVDVLEHYKSVHVATNMINRHLKDVASELKLPPITTYTARYTWATLAASVDVPIEVISQALGHSYGMAVTLGYILPDRRKVDEANRKVLDLILQ